MAKYVGSKIIKEYGNSVVILLDKEDQNFLGIKKGDRVLITIEKAEAETQKA